MSATDQSAGKKKSRWAWLATVGIVLAAIAGGINALGAFTLPSCDSDEALQSVREIFAGKNVPLTTLTGAALVQDGESDRTCSANFETAEEKGSMTYRIYRNGWTKQVQIADVKAQPISDPAS